jgi:DNA polymerase
MPDLSEARALVRQGDYEAVELLYGDVPDTLSQLVRTAFVPEAGKKFIVADFSSIEARVLAWYAGERWRQEVFRREEDIYCASASQMFHVPVEKHGVNGHLRQKGKIAELALGYGGSVGALQAMGALDLGLKQEELQPLVDRWRGSNPHIVLFWKDVDEAALNAVRLRVDSTVAGIRFRYRAGMLRITLPSGRSLCYLRPQIGINRFGGESISFEGLGSTRKWERQETFGAKLVENIVQATARDILCHAMRELRGCRIVMHVHDELVIEAEEDMDLQEICGRMARTPPWAEGLLLKADGFEAEFYKKD